MSEDQDKKLDELSVQDHLDQIQGRTTKRRKVKLEDATAQDHFDHKHDLVEFVRDTEEAEDQEAETEPAPLDVWSVEDHLHKIQNRKRGK